jgi:voltage-gated potassium channel
MAQSPPSQHRDRLSPHAVPSPAAPPPRLDRGWLRSVTFTVGLVGLVAVAAGEEWVFSLSAVLSCAVGFGFFYLLFPGGLHFGVVVANFVAIYACLFVFFRDNNFPLAPRPMVPLALALPLIGFLAGCILRRRSVAGMIRARRSRALLHLPRLVRWVPATVIVGVLSFGVPDLHLGAQAQGQVLLAAMAIIAVSVFSAARDVVLLQMDVALIFENVTERVHELVMPMMAFLTLYSLLVVVFACLFRIAEMATGTHQLAFHGTPINASFPDALYFSLVTLSTVGYGDLAPVGPLARLLSGMEVVSGLLLLLFGFSEIMRGARDRYGQRPGPNQKP